MLMSAIFSALHDVWSAFWSIPHISVWISTIWAGYLVWLAGWIVLQKREPAATLSWLLSLALLPILGFVIYYWFGPQKIKRHRLRRSHCKVNLCPAPNPNDNPEYAELQHMVFSSTGLPPSSAQSVQLLVDGGGKYPRLLEDIAAAQQLIHIEYYIYQPDQSGTALRDALIDAAQRGIKVRLLVDAVGSAKASQQFFQPLVDAGGEVARFHPMRFDGIFRFWKRPWLNLRTHRKIVVIDNHIAYVGGINITDEQDERLNPLAYRDLHLRMEGNAVLELQQVFAEDWIYARPGQHAWIDAMADQPATAANGKIAMQIIASGPDSDWEAIHRAHVSAIHAARKRVWLTTPYFVPGEAGRMALTSAALGGLDVRLLVPKMSDNRLVTYAARSYYAELLRAGVKIYEYGPRLLHSKTLLIDDDLALIGTANFDHRSFRLNFEVQALIQDREVAGQLEKQLENEFAHTPQVKLDEGKKPLLSARLPEAIARLMSPLL